MLLLAAAGPEASAANKTEQRRQAREMVGEALHSEIYGDELLRRRLLADSLRLAPDYPPARWQNGFVSYAGRWVPADRPQDLNELQTQLAEYEQQRQRTPRNPQGWLALANWCRQNGLPAQERAHLWQLIQVFPDHAEARQRLGFQRVNDRWIEAASIWSGLQQSQQTVAAVRAWSPEIAAIARQLKARSEQKRSAATEKLMSIDDVAAIPALELLGAQGEAEAEHVIAALAQMPYHEASLALARIGVFAPLPQLRAKAAHELGQRPRDGYVPALLAELSTPIQSRIERVRVGQRFLFRHAFFRSGQEQDQVVVLDTVYRPPVVRNGTRRRGDALQESLLRRVAEEGIAEMLDEIQQTAGERERQRLLQNAWAAAVNERIYEVLQTATRAQVLPTPQAWWDWWDQSNEVVQVGPKRTSVQYQRDQKMLQVPSAALQQTRHECFVAGTPVWTARGQMFIELIEVGDLVLAQDPDTGQLDYKPVLATTRRPAEELLLVETEAETLEASGGHPLWVNGEGWVLLRKISSGMVLHGLDGSVVVSDVRPGDRQETFNLVVADFHSYFVGRGKVLCHDNTPRRASNSSVPGLRK